MKFLNFVYFVLIFSGISLNAKVTLSNILLCVKNKHSTPIMFASSLKPFKKAMVMPNNTLAQYAYPFYFSSNTQANSLSIFYATAVTQQDYFLQLDPLKSYGTFKNSEDFFKSYRNSIELYTCSIKDAINGIASCKLQSHFPIRPNQSPNDICSQAIYPA